MKHRPATWRRIATTVIGTAAIATGVMAISAPAAIAEPTHIETHTVAEPNGPISATATARRPTGSKKTKINLDQVTMKANS